MSCSKGPRASFVEDKPFASLFVHRDVLTLRWCRKRDLKSRSRRALAALKKKRIEERYVSRPFWSTGGREEVRAAFSLASLSGINVGHFNLDGKTVMEAKKYPAKPSVALIAGDGIGPEISRATVQILDAAGASIDWKPVPAGMSAHESENNPLPDRTLETIKDCGLALKSPLKTPVGTGFRSVNVALRKHFDLYANLRPSVTIPGVPTRYENVDMVIVRENTEDLYAGIEHYVDPRRSAAESIAVITRFGSERIARYAFEYAQKHGRKKVTAVHKANILKLSNGLFLDVVKEVAAEYPKIEFDDMIVDATAMRMVVDPTQFDVIVTMNLFGDILSDLAAGLIGGLGVAGAANIGADGFAIFEAVHGTAPDIAGKGIANPTGLLMSACLLLDHIGQNDVATKVRDAMFKILLDKDKCTGDLGGKANTAQYAENVIAAF